MTTKTVKKPKTPTKSDQDLLCLTNIFAAYYNKSGNTEIALQNSIHTLGILKQACKS
jgi:hypothetical protein